MWVHMEEEEVWVDQCGDSHHRESGGHREGGARLHR